MAGGGGFNDMLKQSRAIMQHVCEGTPLIPSAPKERALMNQWLWVDQCSFKPAFDPIFYQKVLKKVPLNEEQCAKSKVELEATLDNMEGEGAWDPPELR